MYNGLGADYRPWGVGDGEPVPPPFPERVRAFVYACAAYAMEMESGKDTSRDASWHALRQERAAKREREGG